MTILFRENELIIGSTTIPENVTFRFSDILKIGGDGGIDWRNITLSGNGSLTLVNAKANSLTSLKLFGDTEQLAETYIDSVTLEGGCVQSLLPDTYQLYTSVEADGITYEYSSQNLTQIPCKRIADNVFGLYNYTTKVFISEV